MEKPSASVRLPLPPSESGGLSKKGSFIMGQQKAITVVMLPLRYGGSTSSLMTGYLEASMWIFAKEFSDMIATQRGFQANSKIVTVSDEIMSDLIDMKR